MSDSMRDNFNEQDLAQQTLRALEAKSGGNVDDPATFELGQLLRESAVHDLPQSNRDLRELLQQQSFAELTRTHFRSQARAPQAGSGDCLRSRQVSSAFSGWAICYFEIRFLLLRVLLPNPTLLNHNWLIEKKLERMTESTVLMYLVGERARVCRLRASQTDQLRGKCQSNKAKAKIKAKDKVKVGKASPVRRRTGHRVQFL